MRHRPQAALGPLLEEVQVRFRRSDAVVMPDGRILIMGGPVQM